MADFPDHPFWDFSLDVYMTPGVGAACVELQEAHRLDVNVLLYCAWLGASGRGAPSADEMRSVLDAVEAWHTEIVRPLRAVRTRMKGGVGSAPTDLSESLRQRIQKIEIDCEHTEQLMLAAALDRPADPARPEEARASDAAANVALYFRIAGITPGKSDRANCAIVLGVAFPEIAASRIAQICSDIAA